MKSLLFFLIFFMIGATAVCESQATRTSNSTRTIVVDKSSKSQSIRRSSLPSMWNRVVYVNARNGKRLTEAHMLNLKHGANGDVIQVNAKGDTAFMYLKPGAWERVDSVARLVNRPVPGK